MASDLRTRWLTMVPGGHRSQRRRQSNGERRFSAEPWHSMEQQHASLRRAHCTFTLSRRRHGGARRAVSFGPRPIATNTFGFSATKGHVRWDRLRQNHIEVRTSRTAAGMTGDGFYEKGPADPSSRPRLLLLSHHFPPGKGVGALRWRKLAAIAARRGWGIDVITSTAEHAVEGDEWRDLPAGIRVWQVPSPEQTFHAPERWLARLSRAVRRQGGSSVHESSSVGTATTRAQIRWDLLSIRGYMRLYFAAREALKHWYWARRVSSAARRVLRPGVHAVVVTSGPPHAWHSAGAAVAARTGLPHVIDLRDPWSLRNNVSRYLATPAWVRMTRAQEAATLRRAALVAVTTDALREEMAATFPEVAQRLITVMNGYDADPLPPTEYPSTFTISYLGAIYAGRDPRPLFAGVAAAIRELELTPEQLRMRFAGDVQTYRRVPVIELAGAEGIENYLELHGRVPRGEALRLMAQSQVLVSLPWEDQISVPAKLFEYVRFQAWLLVFARRDSAVQRLLRGRDVDLVDAGDIPGITAAIRSRYLQFRQGVRPRPLSEDMELSREHQARILFAALDDVVDSASPAAIRHGALERSP
jgi:glycosyltransferase involved in cell wall biosynthesis